MEGILARNGVKWHENHVNDGVTFAAQTRVIMGADKPTFEKPEQSTQNQFYYILASLAVLFFILYKTYIVVKTFPDPQLSPRESRKLDKRLREIEESEQYALIASMNGWYACLHSGRTTVYLKKGEVWKYGVTSKGEGGRYKDSFLISNKVSYIKQFSGTFSECLKQEQIKLFNYPYLPENLARPPAEHLTRPPYNRIMR